MNQAQSFQTITTGHRVLASIWAWTLSKKGPSTFGDSTGDWVKEREEAVPSQSMAPRQRNSKGTNVPFAASELVGENEVASR